MFRLKFPKVGLTVWFYQDRVYVAGGTKGPNDFTNSVEIFDLKQHAWMSLGTIPEEVSSLGFGVLDHRIVTAGGTKQVEVPTKSTRLICFLTAIFTSARLPVKR